ncbi:hypothetical protein [Demequina sp. NBRC 110051]|uniref:hypothetical protein n=1 Tax=Demequina sp. NBRC 110051 TaxID=1570340 RepID=UPI00117FF3D2|nr:hypothetical protein [Demequina sp. NBRC 110051]
MKDIMRAGACVAVVVGLLAMAGCTSAASTPSASSSPALSPSVTAAAFGEHLDISDPAVAPVADGEWPAQQDGYEFSTEPQGAAEQWIANHYPELWAGGARAVTTDVMRLGLGGNSDIIPSALVQYYDGKRYEGTLESPLGLRGGLNPESYNRDIFNWATGGDEVPRTSPGRYAITVENTVSASANLNQKGNKSTTPVFRVKVTYRSAVGDDILSDWGGEPTSFNSLEQAVDFFKENGFRAGDGRQLNIGELTMILIADAGGQRTESHVLDPETWELVDYAPQH